jgi:hypothetical protein
LLLIQLSAVFYLILRAQHMDSPCLKDFFYGKEERVSSGIAGSLAGNSENLKNKAPLPFLTSHS